MRNGQFQEGWPSLSARRSGRIPKALRFAILSQRALRALHTLILGFVRHSRAVCLPLQLLGVGSLHVQRTGLRRAIGNFDPSTADMGSRARWHPNHVLSLLLNCAGLRGWDGFQIEIQLRRLVRLGFCISDGCLHRAIRNQRHPVNAFREPVCNVATLCIRLDGVEFLAAVFRLDSNICTLYCLSFRILNHALDSRGSGPRSRNGKNNPNKPDL